MTISELQEKVDNWIKRFGVRYFDILTNMAILAEETGEVARIIARGWGEQSFKNSELPQADNGKNIDEKSFAKRELANELADVLWVVTCIANQTDINLEDAIQKSFAKKTMRDNNRHSNNPKLK